MATDGVKIIDGDTAHDVYHGIMDMYDAGAATDAIFDAFPFPPADDGDEFEQEIYVTAWALAAWEIGALTADALSEVRRVIDLGACVRIWAQEVNEKTGRQRQQVLERYWQKISVPNAKPRKRKKYTAITALLFEVNDVLAFRRDESRWGAAIVLKIQQYRGRCTYYIGQTSYNDALRPTAETVAECGIWGRIIPSGLDFMPYTTMSFEEMQAQGGIEAIMRKEALRTGKYVRGLSAGGLDHKELLAFHNRFERVGTLPLLHALVHVGGVCPINNFEFLLTWWQATEAGHGAQAEQFPVASFTAEGPASGSLPIAP